MNSNPYSHLRERLCRIVPVFILIFCALQPVLDALSYWQDQLGLGSSLSFLPRVLLLIVIALVGFILSNRKRVWLLAAGIAVAFWGVHLWLCRSNPGQNVLADTLNYLRILMLPITTLAFISCIKNSEKGFNVLKSGLVLAFGITVLLAVIAVLTGTEPFTYPDKQEGIRGWCFWPNSQSAILSLLAPISIAYVVKKKPENLLLCSLVSILALGTLFVHGTRLAYMSLIAVGVGLAVSVFLTKAVSKKFAVILLVITVLFAACLPFSPMTRNQQKVAENAAYKEQIWNALISEGENDAAQQKLSGEEYEACRLQKGYEFFLTDLVDHFGLDAVLESYNRCEDISVIANERTYKRHFCQLLISQAGIKGKLFGVDCSTMIVNGYSYDVENDFDGIYFLFGYAGLALLLLFLGYFLLRIVRALIKDFKRYFTFEAATFGIALCTCLAHAYFTCGVLRRPNTLFYLAALLAGIYHLTRRDCEMPEPLTK